MLKTILVGTTALTLIGGTLAYAQQTSPTQSESNIAQMRPRFTAEDYVSRVNARISDLKTELKLTADQEKNWTAFETAMRESAKARAEHFEQVRKMHEQGAAAPQGERGQLSADEIADQKKLAAALDPLYKSLDDGQKQRFSAAFRVDGQGRRFWFRGRGDHGDRRS